MSVDDFAATLAMIRELREMGATNIQVGEVRVQFASSQIAIPAPKPDREPASNKPSDPTEVRYQQYRAIMGTD